MTTASTSTHCQCSSWHPSLCTLHSKKLNNKAMDGSQQWFFLLLVYVDDCWMRLLYEMLTVLQYAVVYETGNKTMKRNRKKFSWAEKKRKWIISSSFHFFHRPSSCGFTMATTVCEPMCNPWNRPTTSWAYVSKCLLFRVFFILRSVFSRFIRPPLAVPIWSHFWVNLVWRQRWLCQPTNRFDFCINDSGNEGVEWR